MASQTKIYDAIVVGSGATGGVAAKTLTENGLNVLVLEAGPDLMRTPAPKEEGDSTAARGSRGGIGLGGIREKLQTVTSVLRTEGGAIRDALLCERTIDQFGHLAQNDHSRQMWRPNRQPIQSLCRGFVSELWVDDVDQPTIVPLHTPYAWIRSRQLGGRTQTWTRATPRLRPIDLTSPRIDGHGIPWPFDYQDLAPHYEAAERILNVVGAVDEELRPVDGLRRARPLSPEELQFKASTESRWPERKVLLIPFAPPTAPDEDPGRLDELVNKQRDARGPTYDTSVRHSFPYARATGRLEIRTGTVASRVIMDRANARAESVEYIEADSGERKLAVGRFIVLCASTLESTRLLLNSRCSRWPDGLANSSGALGRYLTDHLFGVGVIAAKDSIYEATSFPMLYIPAFERPDAKYKRSFQLLAEITGFRRGPKRRWNNTLVLSAQGEVLPHAENRVLLDEHVKDKFGIPALRIQYARGENEVEMAAAMLETCTEIAQEAGYEIITESPQPILPGACAHELGTARMGDAASNSVLNGFCQSWDVANLYVMDGAAFPTSSSQNPTVTMMALAHRACGHLIEQARVDGA